MGFFVKIRDVLPSELDFIYNSWLKNFQANSYFAKKIEKKVFMEHHQKILAKIIENPSTIIKIAADENYTIFGYIVAEKNNEKTTVHYCYIRPEYQRLGLARSLITEIESNGPIECSHWTPVLNEIQKTTTLTYNPYAFIKFYPND